MEISGFWQVLGLGALGGGLMELHRWWRLRESVDLPHYAGNARYWFITGLMIIAGGVLSSLYGTESRNAIMVLNIGASAPALISCLSKPPDQSTKGVAPKLRNFMHAS